MINEYSNIRIFKNYTRKINKIQLFGLVILGIFLISSCYQLQNLFTNQNNQNNNTTNQNTNQNPNIQIVNNQLQVSELQSLYGSQNPYTVGSQQQKSAYGNQNDPGTTNGNAGFSKSSASGITFVQQVNDSSWYSDDWSFRKNITIDHTKFSASETNFPLLLDIYDKDLKLALSNGYDILFTNAQNQKLSYERITFNKDYNATYAHLTVWVKGTFSNTTDTIIMMYFGNPFSSDQQDPHGTWSNGYAAVYHLNDNPANKIIDSTGNYNGTAYTGNSIMPSSNSVPGKVGNGIYFDGSSNITLGNINSNSWNGLTLEAWVNFAVAKQSSKIITKQSSSSTIWSYGPSGASNKFTAIVSTDTNGTGSNTYTDTNYGASYSISTWYSLSLVWNQSSNTLTPYINGNSQTSISTTGTSILDSNFLASIGSYTFKGIIDEVRISDVPRSSNWLVDSQANELNPKSFYTVSPTYEQLKLAGNWSFDQLSYRKPIIISHSSVPQMLYNYTIPLTLYDSDLHNLAQTSSFPNDILFADANGNEIGQQIEQYTYNYAVNQSKLIVWVNIPVLSNQSDTTIYMYYGNSTVVRYDKSSTIWSNYSAVWHLSESSGSMVDSTGNGYTGSSNGNIPATGVIGGGQSLNGNGFISVAASNLSTANDVQISGWFKLNNPFTSSSTKSQVLVSKYLDSSDNLYIALIGTDNNATLVPKGSLAFKIEQGANFVYVYTNKTSWSANTWYKFNVVYHKNNPLTNKIYINGIDTTSPTLSYVCLACSISIGYTASWNFGGGTIDSADVITGSGYFNGTIDEFRISKTIFNANEILYNYIIEKNSPNQYSTGKQSFFGLYLLPQISAWGVTDPGDGSATFWARIYDLSNITSAYIDINNTIHPLVSNGTYPYMVYQYLPNISYGQTFTFSIVNATNSFGNTSYGSTSSSYTFTKDVLKPSIPYWDYLPYDGVNGTFRATVNDTWPGLDRVEVHVSCSVACPTPSYANMYYNSSSGYYETSSLYMIGQSISFYVIAYDVHGNYYNTSVISRVVRDKPPVISNASIYTSNGYFFNNQTILISYTYSDPENDTNLSLIQWYLNGTIQPNYTNLTYFLSSDTHIGDTLSVNITAYDSSHSTGNSIFLGPITILNTPPLVSASLNNFTSSQTVVPTITYSDYEGQKLNYTLKWYNNSVEVPALDNLTSVGPSYIKKGESWYFIIAVSDGFNTTIRQSNTIIIADTPPILTGTPTFTKINYTNTENIVANYSYLYQDYDGDLQNTTYGPIILWYINGTYNSTFDNQTFINGSLPHPLNAYYSYIIRVYDGQAYSINYTSRGVSIGSFNDPNPPSALNLIFVQNGGICNNNCTTAYPLQINYTYYDPDGNNTQFGTLFAWYKWNGTAWVLQSSYTSQILPAGVAFRGELWLVYVTPSDGSLYGTIVNATITIVNAPPVISVTTDILSGQGSYVIVTNTTTDKNIYALYTITDADGDPIVETNMYWKNGSSLATAILVPSLNGTSLLPYTLTKKNEYWTFYISVYDGYNWSVLYSVTILIINSAPTVSGIIISGGQNVTVPITTTYTYSDLNNDSSKSIIIWYINNVPYETNLTYLTIPYHAGDSIYVKVQAYDGNLTGNTIISFVVIVADAIPVIVNNGVYLYQDNNRTTSFYANTTLYVNFVANDSDGNYCSVSTGLCYGLYNGSSYYSYGAEYRWYKNGVLTSYTQNFIPYQYLKKGDNWTVSVRPIDQASGLGIWYNSSVIIISDSLPYITSFVWLCNTVACSIDNPTSTQKNLSITYTRFDADTLDPAYTNITWYVNNTVVLVDQTTLDSSYFVKNQNVTVLFQLFDGELWNNISETIFIDNSAPQITSLSINNNQNIYTNQNLTVYWNYYDADGDKASNSTYIILWYLNGNPQSQFNNLRTISSNYTQKGQFWSVKVSIFDGQNYSSLIDSSTFGIYQILNSPPSITYKLLGNNINNGTTYANYSVVLYYSYFDLDKDPQGKVYVIWYLNGTYNSTFDNLTTIPSVYLHKGDVFYAQFKVYDGSAYSIFYTSNSITVVNSPPYVTGLGFIFPSSDNTPASQRNFYLTNENIVFYYNFKDTDRDQNHSIVLWYKNGILMTNFTNYLIIPSSYLVPGDNWSVVLILSDGVVNVTIDYSKVVFIVAAPVITDISQTPSKDNTTSEGVYDITITTNDSDNVISKVEVILLPSNQNDTSVRSLVLTISNFDTSAIKINDSYYIDNNLDFFAINRTLFAQYIGKNITIEIKLTIFITDPVSQQVFTLYRSMYYNYTFEDLTPPRVLNITPSFNNLNNPTELIFNATVVDYGSGVKNVTVIYYFVPLSSANSANSAQFYKLSSDNSINYPPHYLLLTQSTTNPSIYIGSVKFPANASVIIYYTAIVFDNDGNHNSNAYPNGLLSANGLTYKKNSPGLSIEIVALAIGIILLFALAGSYVGIKKFRKTEIVGLDIEKVMDETKKIKNEDVQPLLNTHSLGVVLSTFHQTQGPLPFYALPNILTDNLEKLIDLSDRSFSAVRFVNNFDTEMQISFDYTISSSLHVSSVSYGFSLNRPNLRGGADNITFNILVHKPYDAIINQFINEISPYIHEIHTILDTDEENKELIEKKTELLRYLISKIIVAYQNIYPDENIESLGE